MSTAPEYLDFFVKATEKAAYGASKFIGKGDKIAADKGAVDPLRRELNKINMHGTVVIGEGEMDEAPMLYIGEQLGTLDGPKFDIAVDPLEGTKFTANNQPNAFSVLVVAEKGNLLSAPDTYMEKIAIGSNLPNNRLDLDNPYPKQSHQTPSTKKTLFSDLHEKYITTKDAIGFLSKAPLTNKVFYSKNRVIHNHVGDTNVHDEFWGRKYPVDQFDICDYLKKWRKKAGISTKKVDEHFGYAHTAGHWFRKDNNSGSIPNPDDWKGLKKLLGFDSKYDKQVTTLVKKKIQFEQSLRISNWDTPSDTLTATSPEIHVNLKRRLSVRECAILQTFPDDFVFEGATFRSMHKQIGNAVPVLLAEKVAKEIKQILMKTVILRVAS